MLRAYEMIGFTPRGNLSHFEVSRRLRKINRTLMEGIVRQIEAMGATATWNDRLHLLQINDELRVRVGFARHSFTNQGTSRWVLRWDSFRWDKVVQPDLAVAVRMDRNNVGIHDYYLLTEMQYTEKKLRLAEQNGACLDSCRFKSLDFLVGMAARVKFS